MADKRQGERPSAPARRTIDDMFGEVLPETTSDEREPTLDRPGTDSWYLENRPPHHDR